LLLESTPKIEPSPDSYSLKDGTLLSSTPSIEPQPDTYVLTETQQQPQSHGLRPEKFEGRFDFEEVHFAYPTELQVWSIVRSLTPCVVVL